MMEHTVADVLEAHDIIVNRSHKILCPNHDDTNPSCVVHEDYVYCFTCQWSADAAGLEAKLTNRDVAAVLTEWGGGRIAPRPTERAKRPHELRHEMWLDWVDKSFLIMVKARRAISYLEDWQRDLIMRQTDMIFERANDVCKPRTEDEELAPFAVRTVLVDCENMLRRWYERNTEQVWDL